MSALTKFLADTLSNQPEADIRFGYCALDADGKPCAQIGGVRQKTFWLDGVWANPGDPILTLLVSVTRTTHTAIVLGMLRDRQFYTRDALVLTAPVANQVDVEVNGQPVVADYLPNYTPAIGDRVLLLWHGKQATILNALTVAPVAKNEEPPTQPPPTTTESYDHFRAGDSATWYVQASVWNNRFGQNVYQGTIDGATFEGVWWYGGATTKNAGSTITRTQFRVPARLRVGQYNATLPLEFYYISDNIRGGRPNRVSGPHTFNVPPNFAGQWIDLPVGWGQALADSGGGIAICGSNYVGLMGIPSDRESGTIRQDWKRVS